MSTSIVPEEQHGPLRGAGTCAGPMQVGGLKYFRICFVYGGSTKYLRLTGWSEDSALAEFHRHFPEARPQGVEFLGMV